jgi:hypothetical protein
MNLDGSLVLGNGFVIVARAEVSISLKRERVRCVRRALTRARARDTVAHEDVRLPFASLPQCP